MTERKHTPPWRPEMRGFFNDFQQSGRIRADPYKWSYLYNPYKWPKINAFHWGLISPRNKWMNFWLFWAHLGCLRRWPRNSPFGCSAEQKESCGARVLGQASDINLGKATVGTKVVPLPPKKLIDSSQSLNSFWCIYLHLPPKLPQIQ